MVNTTARLASLAGAREILVYEATRQGEWFHASCWDDGVEPFREIDGGSLVDVLAPS